MSECAACSQPLLPDDRFCEHCGARIAAEPPGDRAELDLVVAGAVSDQGKVHRSNEDAFHVECVDGGVVAVVCDGISTSASADAAARAAAANAGGVLAGALHDRYDLSAAMRDAIDAARAAVSQLPPPAPGKGELPSCTLVAAAAQDGELIVGSVGDSRAYWIAPDDARQLTVDDSWATDQVAEGLLTAAEANADPRAHSVTNWIGPDAPEDPPAVVRVRVAGQGQLVLCSDGLWNYVPDARAIRALLAGLPPGASAVAAARALVEVALDCGGRDNITVVVVEVRPPGGA